MHMKCSSKSHGIGLLELMLSLAIMAALIVFSTMYYSTVSTNQKVTLATNMAHDIYAATKDYTRTGNTISGMSTLISAGYLSSYYLYGPWGGKRPTDLTVDTQGNTMAITFYSVPADACRKLIGRLSQTLNSSTTNTQESIQPANAAGCGFGRRTRSVTVTYALY